MCYYYLLISVSSRDVKEYFVSPDGKNKIVVFEDGFIDAYYTAYPVKYSFFYKNNNDFSADRVDFWGGAKKEIEWKKDYALVYIIFNETEGKNNNDCILVNYN